MTDEQIKALVQLKELKEQGILSQEEFDKEKDRILNGTVDIQGQSQNPHAEQAADDNRNENTAYDSKPVATTKKQEQSWFAKNWKILGLALLYPLAKILIKLINGY